MSKRKSQNKKKQFFKEPTQVKIEQKPVVIDHEYERVCDELRKRKEREHKQNLALFQNNLNSLYQSADALERVQTQSRLNKKNNLSVFASIPYKPLKLNSIEKKVDYTIQKHHSVHTTSRFSKSISSKHKQSIDDVDQKSTPAPEEINFAQPKRAKSLTRVV